MRVNWMIIKILVLLTLLGLLIGATHHRNQSRLIKKTNIAINHKQGNYFVNDSVVLRTFDSGLQPLQKTTINKLKINELEKWLQQNPYIEQANVYANLNAEVTTTIEQKIPIARIKNKQDEFYLTKDAERIPLSGMHSAKVILVQGNITPNDYQELAHFINYINADKLLKKHIVGIQKQSINLFTLNVNWGKYKIELGSLKNIEKKLNNLKIFYRQQLPKVGAEYYSKINLGLNNQIVATKR